MILSLYASSSKLSNIATISTSSETLLSWYNPKSVYVQPSQSFSLEGHRLYQPRAPTWDMGKTVYAKFEIIFIICGLPIHKITTRMHGGFPQG